MKITHPYYHAKASTITCLTKHITEADSQNVCLAPLVLRPIHKALKQI